MKKTALIFAAGLMVMAIIFGCSKENPWEPPAGEALSVFILSGPDTSTAVPHNSTVSFTWGARGGSGTIASYQWYLSPLENTYGTGAMVTSVSYSGLVGADSPDDATYTFYVRATDEAGHTAVASRVFVVSDTAASPPDTTDPTVQITSGPAEGSFVAAGTAIHISWEGSDGKGIFDTLTYQYIFAPTNDTSGWLAATTVTITDVPVADPALFYVRAKDPSGNTSAWDSLSFVIKPASILYIDDFFWTDPFGAPDMVKEREQKRFYRDLLEGYAFAEWDIHSQGMPDSADLVDGGEPVYSTIVFCSDSYHGTTDGTWWYEVGAVGGGVVRYYLEEGGNLLMTGALSLLDMGDYDPINGPTPEPGDFEFDWLGIDSTEWCYDYWLEFTWAVKDPGTSYDLPDSMKIDVAKNGSQLDYAIETPGLQSNTEVIFLWGLDVDGAEPHPYLHPVGHVVTHSSEVRVAMLNFDTFSMPKPEMTHVFQTLLTALGE